MGKPPMPSTGSLAPTVKDENKEQVEELMDMVRARAEEDKQFSDERLSLHELL